MRAQNRHAPDLTENVAPINNRTAMLHAMTPETTMPQPVTRRLFLQSAALPALAWPVAQAVAIDLPRLDDLRPKWDAVSEGDSIEQVVLRMGNPNRRSEVRTLGVSRTDLVWRDIRGPHYTARFFAGRLYAKEVTDSP